MSSGGASPPLARRDESRDELGSLHAAPFEAPELSAANGLLTGGAAPPHRRRPEISPRWGARGGAVLSPPRVSARDALLVRDAAGGSGDLSALLLLGTIGIGVAGDRRRHPSAGDHDGAQADRDGGEADADDVARGGVVRESPLRPPRCRSPPSPPGRPAPPAGVVPGTAPRSPSRAARPPAARRASASPAQSRHEGRGSPADSGRKLY